MAEKKQKKGQKFQVNADLNISVGVEITADSIEDAVKRGIELDITYYISFDNNEYITSNKPKVTGVFYIDY